MAATIGQIKQALRQHDLDGWLFYDFHNRDQLAYRILGLDGTKLTSRRWFYFIPATGDPQKLVHTVEKTKLDTIPGKKNVYLSWEQQHAYLKQILGSPKKIAMQYSPMNNIPYISIVDAGTVELVRSFGHEIVSSAGLVQMFEAVIDQSGYQSHLSAGAKVHKTKNDAFAEIGKTLREGRGVTEFDIQRFILKRFEDLGLITSDPPIVGVNAHPADPHFEPTLQNAQVIKWGDTILIDLWAKEKAPHAIYYDITWVGFAGTNPPEKYIEIFSVVRNARDTAVNFIKGRFDAKKTCYGWEVDQACRGVVERAGFGQYFIHRTGHSIGVEVHGNGANIDNLETKDERQLIPGCCFSIEPGIYLEGEMAVRSEINVFITLEGKVEVTGEMQNDLILIPREIP
ncbi:MAG: M24 family metallopeptidase [Bacteroidota bacterium]